MTTGRRILGRVRQLLGGVRPAPSTVFPDIAEAERRLIDEVAPYTLTSVERRFALIESVRHVLRRGIPGAFVECGVWRGGSALLMIRVLQRAGVSDRDLWLYDTFEGMTAPSERDRSHTNERALSTWEAARAAGKRGWDRFFDPKIFGFDQVKALLEATDYPRDRLHFVRGPVEQTLPAQAPDAVAVLRLDTDWYESTRHELEHLYPRLSAGGVLIVDDYGHWRGCREAVDEYFAKPGNDPLLLSRIDYTGRIAVKQ